MRFLTLVCFLAAVSRGQMETSHIKGAQAAYDAGRTADEIIKQINQTGAVESKSWLIKKLEEII